MKIMICEQDLEQIKLIKNILNNYKFKHIIPKKGVDIFQMILTQKPSIIIYNEKFDKNTGVSLVNKLRANENTRHIPLIYIYNRSGLQKKINEYSGDSFLQFMKEPYRIKFLRHYIDRWTTFRSLYIKQ